MIKKRCTDCKYTEGIGYDFWCGEGHTEYEVFGAETNCPYYEYHDWSKGTPSRTEKRFELSMSGNEVAQYEIIDHSQEILTVYNNLGNVYFSSAMKVCELLNSLVEENEELKQKIISLEDARYSYKQDWKQASADCELYKDEIKFLKDENKGLIKENEQLKKENNYLTVLLASIKGAFEENSILTKSDFEKVVNWND